MWSGRLEGKNLWNPEKIGVGGFAEMAPPVFCYRAGDMPGGLDLWKWREKRYDNGLPGFPAGIFVAVVCCLF